VLKLEKDMNKNIVYFDNAATSWPKPDGILKAIEDGIVNIGANPGRSGHSMSVEAARRVFQARELVSTFFNVGDSDRVAFTSNGTHALNMAINGFVGQSDHVITSSIEHNSVMRPLRYLEKARGINLTVIGFRPDGTFDIEAFRETISNKTRLVVLNHASNVTGSILPIREIGQICKDNNVKFLVDVAQTAGIVPIDMQKDNIDLLAFTGHKALFGPQGIGGLCINENIKIDSLMQGGSGSKSELEEQPDFLPDKLEAGTLNTVGIMGLEAGLKYILNEGLDKIFEHKQQLVDYFFEKTLSLDRIEIYSKRTANVGIISFNISGIDSDKVGYLLDKNFGIMARMGLHCSPGGHKTIGTFPNGTVRFSFSIFNQKEEIDYAIDALKQIIKGDIFYDAS
jgi:cysteine desulfurase / selenocysteine lyase